MGERPNIIFYFSDQQRWDTMGCYGQKLPVTPNLDKMAEEGALFENAYTCQPVCGPARACLQTGRYATETGCYRNNIALPQGIPTLAQSFNEAGYDTAYVGKWHLASDSEHRLAKKPTPPERRGGYKDYWMASDVLEFTSHGYNGYVFDKDGKKVRFRGYRTDSINGYALDYLKNRNSENPFFLFVSHIEPHHQNDRMRFESPRFTRREFKDYEIPGDLQGTGGDWRLFYPNYLSCCNRIDKNFGELVKLLKEQGIYDNTIIFYTSDHGCHFKTRNGEYKRSCHDGSIHIPLIVTGGAFKGRGHVSEMVSLLDLPVTMLDCAGIKRPEGFKGDSLLNLANGSAEDWKDHVFLQISESQVGRAVRTEKWKYSVKAPDKNGWDDSFSDVYYDDFLYDLENDLYERNNLIYDEKYNDVKADLRRMLLEDMQKAGEPKAEIRDKK